MRMLITAITLLLITTACKSESQKRVEQNIDDSIVAMRNEMDSIVNTAPQGAEQETASPVAERQLPRHEAAAEAADIVGVWEVKNDYYMAIYEIEEYRGQYIGKVHYYNDGSMEYEGTNSEDDYFLADLIYQNGSYMNGKMFTPDGTEYKVSFTQVDEDTLEAKMNYQGTPYTELWNRQK